MTTDPNPHQALQRVTFDYQTPSDLLRQMLQHLQTVGMVQGTTLVYQEGETIMVTFWNAKFLAVELARKMGT